MSDNITSQKNAHKNIVLIKKKKKDFLCLNFITIYKCVQSSLPQGKKLSRNFCLTEILQVGKLLILTSG